MAQLIIDPIKYLSKLLYYDGNTNDLQIFCYLVERIMPLLATFDVGAQPMFVDIIKSKLKGQAKLVIDINCHVISWLEIKNILTNNFSDKKTCEELYDEMRSVTFKSNCVDFYNDMRDKLRRLNNKTLIVLGMGSALSECTKNNRKSALSFFISKIPEPMKSILVCRDPDTIEEAMDILFKAGYAYHTRANNVPKQHGNSKNNDASYNNRNYNSNDKNFRSFENDYKNSNSNVHNNNNNNNRDFRPNKNNNNQNPNLHSNNSNNRNYRPYNNQYSNSYNNRNTMNPFNRNNDTANNSQNTSKNVVEPMEVGHYETQPEQQENFRLPASNRTYHI